PRPHPATHPLHPYPTLFRSEGTVDIAIYLTLRSILLDTALHEPVPTNSGLFRPIRITAPEGSLANPRFPAPTIARFVGGNMVAEDRKSTRLNSSHQNTSSTV